MENKSEEIILKGRLNGTQRNRLASLLDMFYKPSELAKEIGFARRQVYRVYVPVGCPHKRDEKRYIWIRLMAKRFGNGVKKPTHEFL